jgi:hypothetical protein
MSLLLTVYDTPAWKAFVDTTGLPQIKTPTSATQSSFAILDSIQSLSSVADLLPKLLNEQTLWLAAVQAEYFIASEVEQGKTLAEAANTWKQQTTALLGLQRQQRKKLQLFNLHQALAYPAQFRLMLSQVASIKEYPEHKVAGTFTLLSACQYLAQHSDLQTLNTRLQASAIPLCEDEKLILNVDHILHQSQINAAAVQERDQARAQLQQIQKQLESTSIVHSAEREKKTSELKSISEERDLILAQLHQVQEKLEQYYLALHSEQQNNKHTLLARDKQHARETAKLEAELRKTKACAANAEYSGLLLQQELKKLRASISWKVATPVRVLGRIIRKNDPQHEKLLQDVGLLLTSEYFDVEWYLRHYPDVEESKMNPAEHYLLYGAAEGRLPSPLFDGNWYLQQYPDVAEAGSNPLLHFITYGLQEGRNSSPKFLMSSQANEDLQ